MKTEVTKSQSLLASIIFIMVLLVAHTNQASAADFELPGNIRMVVTQFLKNQFNGDPDVKFHIGKLDPRLRLTKCTQNMEAFIPDTGRLLGYTTIGLRCNGPQTWSIHVPVTIQQFKQVLVSNRNLPRGHKFTAADTMLKKMDISRLHQGFYEKPEQLTGLVLKRSILRGQQLNPGILARARLVQRGQTITILAKTGSVVIRAKGKAMMDGREGQLIKIKNISTNKELRGIVVAEGVVQLTL